MNCTLYLSGEYNKAGREVRCKHPGCERVLWIPWTITDETIYKLRAECQVGKAGPGLASKILSYAVEYARWLQHGKPTRTPEQIAVNQQVCMSCEFFQDSKKDPAIGWCKLCGCGLNGDSSATNKHYMGTTKCPYPPGAKWLPIVDIEE